MDILQMSFSAAVLITAIVILRAITLYSLPKRTFLVLWGIVVCRLLIPFSLSSRFSIYTGIDMLKQALKETEPSAVALVSGVLTVVPDTGATGVGEIAGGGAPAVSASISLFMLIWLIGIGVCAAFFLIAYIKCRREFKTALPVQSDFIADWQKRNPLRPPVRIRQSDRIKAPLTYGVFRPVVLLPGKTDWTDEEKLRYVLTHEYVHIKRFDMLAKLVLTAAVCVHWFNPFVWAMYALANRDIELACDEAVLQACGEENKSVYALTLIGLEEKKRNLAPLVSGFSKNASEERITAIMKIKKHSVPVIVAAVLLVASLTVGFATSGVKADDDAGSQSSAVVSADLSPSPDGALSNGAAENSAIAAESSGSEAVISGDGWVWPVEGCYTVTSRFGTRIHPVTGITDENDHICISGDNADGANVYAALSGTVSDAGYDYEQGNYIRITHDNGIDTIYQHLKDTFVSAGDAVAAGGTIGTVGKTGTATGPCLGFCVYADGVAVNSLEYYTVENGAYVSSSQEPSYPQNSKGETYGNDLMAQALGYAPDLVAAIGTEGQSGYIREKDVPGADVSNPEEATEYMEYMKTLPSTIMIPLYDQEGNVIGEFGVSNSCSGGNDKHFDSLDEAREAVVSDG